MRTAEMRELFQKIADEAKELVHFSTVASYGTGEPVLMITVPKPTLRLTVEYYKGRRRHLRVRLESETKFFREIDASFEGTTDEEILELGADFLELVSKQLEKRIDGKHSKVVSLVAKGLRRG